MKLPIPDTIASRTLVVLVIGFAVSHALSVALYFADRTNAFLSTDAHAVGERIVTIDRLAAKASPAERRRIAELADGPGFHVTWSPQSAIDDLPVDEPQGEALRDVLIAHLRDGGARETRFRYDEAATAWQEHFRQSHPGGELGAMMTVSLRFPDRGWLNFAVPVEPAEAFWSLRFALSLVVMVLTVGLLSALVVHHMTKPLAAFARAAQRLGVDVKAPPLPEHGPAEVRQAARAFNEMQARIRRFVEDRTQMVAAISHDLGTPITRLRLRAEFVEDETQREKVLADLDEMEKMVFSTLSLARDESTGEPRAMVDLRTLLQRACDGVADTGHTVALEAGEDAVPYGCQPVALRRALTNLIENAVKYGHRARVSLAGRQDGISIRIDDDGPGIPEELHEDVFKPFRRLEVSRSRETGGAGLGLTLARTIVRAHGGDVVLVNRDGGGLRVEVSLPR